MKCPKCKKEIDIGKQVEFADKEWYQGIEPPILLMIECDNKCKLPTAMINIETVGQYEDVKSPALGNKIVKVPKLKS